MQIIRDWYNKHFSDPQLVILALLLVIGTIIILTMGKILAPVLASLIIAYLLEGVVRRLERIHTPRPIAVIIVFLLFMVFLIFLLFILLPSLSLQIGQVVRDLPSMINKGQKELMGLPDQYPELISKDQISSLTKFLQTELGHLGKIMLSYSMASVRGIVTFLVYLILMPLMVFFFLKDKGLLTQWVSSYLPENRTVSSRVWLEFDQQIGNFLRGKFLEILIIWGVSYITFLLMDLRFTMLVSLSVGLSVLVPYIGVTVMTFPVALVAFFQWGLSSEFFYIILAYSIIQLLDGNLLAPLLLSEVVNLHPVAIISAVLVFGGIWGFWGVFFAIPLATLIHAVLRAWQLRIRDVNLNGNDCNPAQSPESVE
jgi:putative permease